MAWTRTEIRALVRQLSGLRATGQLSDADLDLAINQYYLNVFPINTRLADFEDFYEFDTEDAVQSYAIPDTVFSVEEPISIDDGDGDAVQFLTFSRNKDGFFRTFVEDDSAATQQPETILVWRRYFYLGPIPDDAYTIKMPALQKPTAISGSVNPLRDAWGPAIAYGTAVQLLLDAKDTDGAASITPMWIKRVDETRSVDQGQLVGMRAQPRF